MGPRMVNPLNARNPIAARGLCFECGGTDQHKAACPRLNRAPRQGRNRQNQVMAIEGGQGRRNNCNPTRGGAFMMGAEEAHRDPNIMTEPSNLGFSYGIEIASGQLVEINKVIRGCKLEIEGHTFDIDLIPFGHGSFNVIVRMDWLSRHKAEIVCHEKVVRIPLLNGEMLRVLGERPKEEHEMLLRLVLDLLKKEKLYAKFPNRFIKNFSKISKSLTILTHKSKMFDWGEEQEAAFQTLKDRLCNAPVLALLDGLEDFVVYYDASCLGLGCVLVQRGKVIAHASR
ncbi:reverse transcriptase domain-containing protein [Tanacetum coccineum]